MKKDRQLGMTDPSVNREFDQKGICDGARQRHTQQHEFAARESPGDFRHWRVWNMQPV
jgi:hypothetical protein